MNSKAFSEAIITVFRITTFGLQWRINAFRCRPCHIRKFVKCNIHMKHALYVWPIQRLKYFCTPWWWQNLVYWDIYTHPSQETKLIKHFWLYVAIGKQTNWGNLLPLTSLIYCYLWPLIVIGADTVMCHCKIVNIATWHWFYHGHSSR